MQFQRDISFWHFKDFDISKRLWGFELISNYHPSITNYHFYYERLKKLRFKPLATTVYLSHSPSPTPSRNLSSNRFPKCIRNKGCFIFLQEIEIGNDILIYIKIKNEFSRHIFITHAASETLKCLNATEHDSYISISTQ